MDYTRDLATGMLVLRKSFFERPTGGAPRTVTQQSSATPVSIVINGRRSEVNVATRADADKLSDLLRQLQDDFARSGG